MIYRLFIIVAISIAGTLYSQETKVVKTKDLKFHVYSAKPQNFGVTSVLLEGKKDLVLIDAQFSKEEAKNVVELIKKTKKTLKTIYISHSDPDYYFGLDIISENFPDAKIISTAQTAYYIDVTKDNKLELWGPILKENAPSKIIVPQAYVDKSFSIEGIEIEIKQSEEDPLHSYLWIPSTKTILGGVSLFDGIHVWIADSLIKADRLDWLRKLDEMNLLSSKMVIPGHFDLSKNPNLSPNAIEYTKKYIIAFENSLLKSKDYDTVMSYMLKLYPNAGGLNLLETSVGVHTGQLKWELAGFFPAIGNTIEVYFDDRTIEYNFKDNKRLSIKGKEGIGNGATEDVIYTAEEIRDNIYMVYWTEPKTKNNVVQIYDFTHDSVYCNISLSDNTSVNLKGRISGIKFNNK